MQPHSDDNSSWERLTAAYQTFGDAAREFLQDSIDRPKVITDALNKGGLNRMTALAVIRSLPLEDKERIFPTLVYLAAGSQGTSQAARDLIAELPSDWVLANIETVAESILANGSDEDFRGILQLYQQLDAELLRQLAERASKNIDPDIRLAGEDFLGRSAA